MSLCNASFGLLFLTNLFEFSGRVLLKLASTIWLYERTGSGLALGAIGLVQLFLIVPSTLYGGVLADMMDRRRLVVICMSVCGLTAATFAWLCHIDRLHPLHVYVGLGAVMMASKLEGSARAALIGTVVPARSLAHAVSITTVTQQVGEIVAPIVFGTIARATSLAPAFAVGGASYLLAAMFPLCITYDAAAALDDAPAAAEEKPALLPDEIASGSIIDGCAPETLPLPAPTTAPSSACVSACAGARASLASLAEGLAYVWNHPLLPGLYALDWALTAFTYYRDLFPMFVATLFTAGRFGLNARSSVVLLTAVNHLGGICGGALTFACNAEPHKGRHVILATLCYGCFAALFGASRHLAVGAVAVFFCGASDSVGMNMRKTVAFVTTPDRLRGRAYAAHSLAANLANALGLIYVAAMAHAVGAGYTMLLGSALTWLSVFAIVLLMPALWRYSDAAKDLGAVTEVRCCCCWLRVG